jgi:hypothetical protein
MMRVGKKRMDGDGAWRKCYKRKSDNDKTSHCKPIWQSVAWFVLIVHLVHDGLARPLFPFSFRDPAHALDPAGGFVGLLSRPSARLFASKPASSLPEDWRGEEEGYRMPPLLDKSGVGRFCAGA